MESYQFYCYGGGNDPWEQGSWANMGPTWGRHDPGGPHVGHMDVAIWDDDDDDDDYDGDDDDDDDTAAADHQQQ